MSRSDALKATVLAMVAGHPDRPMAWPDGMDDRDWLTVADMARRHRLEALLHHRAEAADGHWPVPADLRAAWATAYRHAHLRLLRAQATLQNVDRVLRGAGIPYAALKGSWLAWQAYPDPALRPMRDVDVLIGSGEAREAFDLLAAHGFERIADDDVLFGEVAKHLPSLRHPHFNIVVEVHRRLDDGEHAGSILGDAEAILATRIEQPVGTSMIAYPDPAVTLLHLVVHALYSHRFDNGPITLTDIAALARTPAFDWSRFWALADAGGLQAASRLLLDTVAYWTGPLPGAPVAPGGEQSPPALCRAAGLMMLPEADPHKAVHAWTNTLAKGSLRGLAGRLGRWWRRSDAGRIAWDPAAAAGDGERSSLARRLLSRSLAVTGALADRGVRADVQRSLSIERWLREQS